MKTFTAGLSFVILVGITVLANATLIDRGTGMYDTESGLLGFKIRL
jgi:hypothetical protein